jgi:hypothetical protein
MTNSRLNHPRGRRAAALANSFITPLLAEARELGARVRVEADELDRLGLMMHGHGITWPHMKLRAFATDNGCSLWGPHFDEERRGEPGYEGYYLFGYVRTS